MNEHLTPSADPSAISFPELTPESAAYLLKAAKWGKFLAILGFIATAFLVIAGIAMGFIMNRVSEEMMPQPIQFPPAVLSVFYIIFAGIYIVPVIYLNSFCNQAIRAIHRSDTPTLTMAFKNLKNLFVFLGILTIVVLVLYMLAIVVAGAAAVMAL
jgi:hypothetical protein